MPFLKIAGAAAVVLSSYMTLQELNRKSLYSLACLDGFISFLRYIRVQIECYGASVGEIFVRAGEARLEACGCRGRAENFSALLDGSDARLSDEITALLKAFSRELGKSYRDAQIKSCDYYIEQLSEKRTELAALLPRERAVRTALVMSSSAALIIFLL